jgi:hypothetical protein
MLSAVYLFEKPKEFRQANPTNCGHCTVAAATELGWTKVDFCALINSLRQTVKGSAFCGFKRLRSLRKLFRYAGHRC